ncbi:hypothetical protein V8F20_010292 [Naviculisporaceae sp. PSN 640]
MADPSQPPPPPSRLSSRTPWIRPRKKYLIQMSGPPGAGKSTLAKTLACQLREKYGLGAVVINHDLIKDFFVDPEVGEILSSSSGRRDGDGAREGNGRGNGVSFTDAARLSYKLDWLLVWDMFEQGQDVVVLDSVCNYREAVENGLGLVRRWNSESVVGTKTKKSSESSDTTGTGVTATENENDKGEMAYVYVECRFGDGIGEGDGDLEALDKRLKQRAERAGALRSQRVGVFEGPAGDVGQDGRSGKTEKEKEKEAVELFRKWMNPARPSDEDGAILVVVDSRTMKPEDCAVDILMKIGL